MMNFIAQLSRLKYNLKKKLTLEYYRTSGKTIIHFIHIGKTGGTAIKSSLEKVRGLKSIRFCLHYHETKLSDIPISEKVIFSVRDPETRFVSGFYSRLRKGQPRYNVPWSPEEKKVFSVFKSPNELAIAITSKNKEEKSIALLGMRSIEHICSFQSDWLIGREELRKRKKQIILACRQETLNRDFEEIKLFLSLPREVNLPKKTSIQAHTNPITDDKTLTSVAKNNIREWYKKDYELIRFLEEEGFRIVSK